MLEITVGHDTEDYWTIQEALDAVPYECEARIVVSEGVYREKLFCDKRSLELVGKGKVTVVWDDAARTIMPDGIKRGTFRTYTAFFSGHELSLENMTFRNEAGRGSEAGQALALYLDVDRASLVDVELFGHQDTLFLAPLPEKEREVRGFYGPRFKSPRKLNTVHMKGGRIWGGVDFIFGGADALFEDVEIISNEPGYVSAPSGKKEDIGFIFSSCRFLSEDLEEGSVYLMRPWRPEGKAAFRKCTYDSHINAAGFSPWHGLEGEAPLASFRVDDDRFGVEYMSDGIDADVKALLGRFDA